MYMYACVCNNSSSRSNDRSKRHSNLRATPSSPSKSLADFAAQTFNNAVTVEQMFMGRVAEAGTETWSFHDSDISLGSEALCQSAFS